MARFNVVFVVFDTLRWDRVGCLGSNYPTMPSVDSLCRESMAFTNHYSEAIPTHPSFTTMFTGTTPLIHGIVSHAGSVRLGNILMLAELLNREGYVTIAVDNLATHTMAGWFARGYGYYFNIGGLVVISRGVKTNGDYVNVKAREAFDLLTRYHRGESFFMFIHYWDPHTPYIPPKGYAERFYKGDYTRGDLASRLNSTKWGKVLLRGGWMRDLLNSGVNDLDYVRALYDGEVAYVDERFSELMRMISDLGLLEDTIIIITSDHGEGLGEHNVFFDHHTLYEWDVKTPLIIRLPDKLTDEIGRGRVRGVAYSGLVQNTDIAPTILDALGVAKPSSMTGVSLLEAAKGNFKGHDAVYSLENTRQTTRMIRVGEWKLIQWIRDDTYGKKAGHIELYNLAKDPAESRNLAEEERETALRLLGLMEERYRRIVGSKDPLTLQEISLPISEDKPPL
ncbi:MAG: sulfatase [Caldivirga sp.]|uniref:sulfatase n=1 Tax=Caldivirga sp. TaxID=2080243 RepID=UPI003D13483B